MAEKMQKHVPGIWKEAEQCFKKSTLVPIFSDLSCNKKIKPNTDTKELKNNPAQGPQAMAAGTLYNLPISFKNVPNISIDKAIIEKTNDVAVVPSCFSWEDLGTWDSVCAVIFPATGPGTF